MNVFQFENSRLRLMIPSRHHGGNKYTHGGVAIVAGSRGMSGAAELASKSALRSGAGIVFLFAPESLMIPLSAKLTEPVLVTVPETSDGSIGERIDPVLNSYLDRCRSMLIGCGLSRNSETAAMVRKTVVDSPVPVVLDGDGLSAFAGYTELFRSVDQLVLTPHDGEWNRLFGPIPTDLSERTSRVSEVASDLKITILLKGVPTLVADPDGSVTVIHAGNSGMATAGSGDVLAGIIAALIAQGAGPTDAAIAGAAIHGLAGDCAAKRFSEYSMIASDMIDYLGETFLGILGDQSSFQNASNEQLAREPSPS